MAKGCLVIREVSLMTASTKNFNPETDRRLTCSCGCKANEVEQWALDKLQLVRDDYGKGMTVRSGYRWPKLEAEARKEKPGTHNKGVAFDIACDNGYDRLRLVELGRKHGAKGIGVAKTFVHLDWRDGLPVMWSY